MFLIIGHRAEKTHSAYVVSGMEDFANTEDFIFADAHEVKLADDRAVFKDLLKIHENRDIVGFDGDFVKNFLNFSVLLWREKF
jgi:hypothetical protein